MSSKEIDTKNEIANSFVLEINAAAQEVIIADGERSFPDECCGFFFGKEGEERRIITHALEVVNNKEGDKRRRFEIHPSDYMKAEKFSLVNELDFLGVYHSHPNHPAIPSEHDRIVALPFFSYIIISVYEGKLADFRSYRLNEERQFEEEEVVLENKSKTI